MGNSSVGEQGWTLRKGIPGCRRGGERRRSGQRSSEAARPAVQATARALGLARLARVGSRPRSRDQF